MSRSRDSAVDLDTGPEQRSRTQAKFQAIEREPGALAVTEGDAAPDNMRRPIAADFFDGHRLVRTGNGGGKAIGQEPLAGGRLHEQRDARAQQRDNNQGGDEDFRAHQKAWPKLT